MNRNARTWVAVALALLLVAGVAVLFRTTDTINRTNVVGVLREQQRHLRR